MALVNGSENLLRKAERTNLPSTIRDSILAGKSGAWDVGGSSVELKREDWATGKGYELRLILKKQ